MNKKILAALLLLLGSPLPAVSYDPDFAQRNFADELAQCAAFYMISAQAPGLDKPASEKMTEAGKHLATLSADMSSEKLALARIDLNTKTMMRDMDNTWDNFAILLNKYAYPCKDVAEHPNERLHYWLDKKE